MTEQTFAPGLPEMCYVTSPYTGGIVKVIRGENNFFGCRVGEVTRRLNRDVSHLINRDVTRAQVAAMRGGVMYGWQSAHADPANYTEQGVYTGPVERRKDEDDGVSE